MRFALNPAPETYDATFMRTMAGAYLAQTPWTRLRLETLQTVLEPVAGERVLDLGCAAGAITHFLSTFGCDAVGVDLEQLAIETARSTFPGLDFRQADVCALPFPDGSFEKAVAADVIEHLDDTTFARMLADVRRVLVPGGRLVVYTPNPRHPIERLKARDLVLAGNATHIGLRRAAAIERAFASAGLEPELSTWRPSFIPGLRPLERLLGPRLESMRYRLCLRARRGS